MVKGRYLSNEYIFYDIHRSQFRCSKDIFWLCSQVHTRRDACLFPFQLKTLYRIFRNSKSHISPPFIKVLKTKKSSHLQLYNKNVLFCKHELDKRFNVFNSKSIISLHHQIIIINERQIRNLIIHRHDEFT